MKINKKYYPYLIALGVLLIFVFYFMGGSKAKEMNYDYVGLPKDGIEGA